MLPRQNPETMRELQVEVVGLLEELKALSERNEELLAEKDSDLATIRQLDDEVREYKRRWETTKTELRNLKGGRFTNAISGRSGLTNRTTLSSQPRPPCSSPSL
jgi:uncharacterized protein (DUF3084 family)